MSSGHRSTGWIEEIRKCIDAGRYDDGVMRFGVLGVHTRPLSEIIYSLLMEIDRLNGQRDDADGAARDIDPRFQTGDLVIWRPHHGVIGHEGRVAAVTAAGVVVRLKDGGMTTLCDPGEVRHLAQTVKPLGL